MIRGGGEVEGGEGGDEGEEGPSSGAGVGGESRRFHRQRGIRNGATD